MPVFTRWHLRNSTASRRDIGAGCSEQIEARAAAADSRENGPDRGAAALADGGRKPAAFATAVIPHRQRPRPASSRRETLRRRRVPADRAKTAAGRKRRARREEGVTPLLSSPRCNRDRRTDSKPRRLSQKKK